MTTREDDQSWEDPHLKDHELDQLASHDTWPKRIALAWVREMARELLEFRRAKQAKEKSDMVTQESEETPVQRVERLEKCLELLAQVNAAVSEILAEVDAIKECVVACAEWIINDTLDVDPDKAPIRAAVAKLKEAKP